MLVYKYMKIILSIVGVVLMGIGFTIIKNQAEVEVRNDNNDCIIQMQKAIPDANDTEARSSFLKDCNK